MVEPTPGQRPEHYHALTATERWKKYLAAIDEHATRAPGARAATDRERQEETTYARADEAKEA